MSESIKPGTQMAVMVSDAHIGSGRCGHECKFYWFRLSGKENLDESITVDQKVMPGELVVLEATDVFDLVHWDTEYPYLKESY